MYYEFWDIGLQISTAVDGECPAWIVTGGAYLRGLALGATLGFVLMVLYPAFYQAIIRRPMYQKISLLIRNKAVVLFGMVAAISIILLAFAYIIAGSECLIAAG